MTQHRPFMMRDSAGTTLASYAYALDNVGNRIGVTETLLLQLLPNRTTDTRTVAYTYDSLYRLLSATITGDSQGGNGTVSYTYDLVGNRLSRTSSVTGISTSTSQYNANNDLTSETAAGVTTTYTYDANGNTIETSGGGVTTTFTYDSQNRLVKQNAGTAGEIDIAYDGQGNKVAETATGATTKYLIDTNNPTGYSQIVEEIVNGLVTRRYALGQWIISETQLINGAWVRSFYNYDGHNTVRFLTNASGAVTDNYTFDAFGIKIAGAGTTPNQILYTGEYLDPGTGNYDLRARVYNQNTGTFLTRDTYAGQNQDPTTLHQYLYAGANPVNMVDPSGNDFTLVDTLAGIGALSALNASAGALIGGIQDGVRGAIGGAVDGFTSTASSLLAALAFSTAGIQSATPLAFGFGAVLGSALDMRIRGLTVCSMPGLVSLSASFLFGAVGGAVGGADAFAFGQSVGQRLLQTPTILENFSEILDGQGVHLVSEGEFVTYYAAHPLEFVNIFTKYITAGTIAEDALGLAKLIGVGLLQGKAQGLVSQAIAQPVMDIGRAIGALFDHVESALRSGV